MNFISLRPRIVKTIHPHRRRRHRHRNRHRHRHRRRHHIHLHLHLIGCTCARQPFGSVPVARITAMSSPDPSSFPPGQSSAESAPVVSFGTDMNRSEPKEASVLLEMDQRSRDRYWASGASVPTSDYYFEEYVQWHLHRQQKISEAMRSTKQAYDDGLANQVCPLLLKKIQGNWFKLKWQLSVEGDYLAMTDDEREPIWKEAMTEDWLMEEYCPKNLAEYQSAHESAEAVSYTHLRAHET